MSRVHKYDAAKEQLVTAVEMFLNGRDRSSVITLAGAASGIFDELVRRSGKEAFVDYGRRLARELNGKTPKRSSYVHHVNTKLGVTVHKHLWDGESDTVDLDLETLAADAVLRAMVDYMSLSGEDEPFVKAYLHWRWTNEEDGPGLIERYKQVPQRMKPK